MEKAAIMSGYGLNSEMETKVALEKVGMSTDIVHINDLISKEKKLSNYRLLVFPGGFSYGDDTGAGNAYANRLRNNLWPELQEFLDSENLVLGICNGFQILVNLGVLPAFNKPGTSFQIDGIPNSIKEYKREIALMQNKSGVLECRFVTIKPIAKSFWTNNIERIYCPIAHGEGNFYCDVTTLKKIKERDLIAFRYVNEDLSEAKGVYPANPNGSLDDIAGVTSENKKVLGIMPHPERAMEFTNLYNWPLLKEKLKREGKELPDESLNMQIFKNIVGYFR
ncbi:MAG TPA: phosphoribosylformylglycinamidine synthase I [Candidatus Bilamarchaeaceae archaeon]|nr:phosphoribosylformylglycinamidine synthase I [Candidatus Bilamarchaeaceae archaeon]